jgi:putative membrane protein
MPVSPDPKSARGTAGATENAIAKVGETVADAGLKVAQEAGKVKESARHLEKSAVAVERSTDLQLLSAERRTQLAADRTVLAAERTFSAWVRTGLAALATGVGARTLLEDQLPAWLVRLTGSVLVAFAVFCFVAAVWRQLQPGVPPPQPDTHRLPPFILVCMNGLLIFVSLAALVQIWFGRIG